jgi:hypothetical protein
MRSSYPRIVALLLVAVSVPGALACATCFGRSDSPLAEGMNMGIVVLLGVVLTVLAGFASFFIFLARRAAVVQAAAPAEASSRV